MNEAEPAPRRPRYPHHLLAYVLSLPERLVRFVGGLLGQVGLIITRLLPRPIRDGKFYRLAVERQLRMLTDELGRANLFPAAVKLDGELATRMAVGGAADNLMMIGLHASPLWILLAATDVSKGAASFLKEVGQELQDAGVMKPGSRIDSLSDVLDGMSNLSNHLADTVDAPPFSPDAMKATLSGVRDELHRVGGGALAQVPDVDALASEVRSLAKTSDHSLLETMGAVGVGTMRGAGNLLAGGLVGTRATLGFVRRVVWNDVFGDYFRTVKRMKRRGFYGSVRQVLRPQTRSIRAVFRYAFLSWTEWLLSFGQWRKARWRVV